MRVEYGQYENVRAVSGPGNGVQGRGLPVGEAWYGQVLVNGVFVGNEGPFGGSDTAMSAAIAKYANPLRQFPYNHRGDFG